MRRPPHRIAGACSRGIRTSGQTPGGLAVSVNGGSRVKHFSIARDTTGGFQFGERFFPGIVDLVNFYNTRSIFTTAENEGICLSEALDRGLAGEAEGFE